MNPLADQVFVVFEPAATGRPEDEIVRNDGEDDFFHYVEVRTGVEVRRREPEGDFSRVDFVEEFEQARDARFRWTLPDRVNAARRERIESAWPTGRWFGLDEALAAGLPSPLRKLLLANLAPTD